VLEAPFSSSGLIDLTDPKAFLRLLRKCSGLKLLLCLWAKKLKCGTAKNGVEIEITFLLMTGESGAFALPNVVKCLFASRQKIQ
jgi:hypothetical protein